MKIPALVGKKDFDNVFKNSDTSFSSGPFVVILKKNEKVSFVLYYFPFEIVFFV